MPKIWLISILAAFLPVAAWTADDDTVKSFEFILANIDDRPSGFGVPAVNRNAWNHIAATGTLNDAVTKAELALKKNYRQVPDNLYLEYFTSGNRTGYEQEINSRRADLRFLAIAECIEYRGRFLLQIEQILRAFCSAKTWVIPAHDRQQANFSGQQIDIDLNSSAIAWDMATVLWLHGNKISQEVQNLVRDNINHRVLFPFRDMITGKRPPQWWMNNNNNWNPVCLTGIAGAATAIVINRKDRALYVSSCIDLSRRYINAFPSDGYCNEGVGYWVYGFGHYLLFTEMLFETTSGKLNLLTQDRKAAAPAMFPDRIRITDTVYPTFADADMNVSVSDFYPALRDRLMGRASAVWKDLRPKISTMSLPQVLVASFLPKPQKLNPELKNKNALPPRSFFPDSRVLVCRPGTEFKKCRLAAAMRAGNNYDSHHHNDLGSYILVLDNLPMVVDPGKEVYTARTFSKKRFDSNVINSYGHSVPVIDGIMQHEGKNVIGKTLDNTFERNRDWWLIDLAPAYSVPSMISLTRAFAYDREKQGIFSVTDSGKFSQPVAFETAVVTFGQWQQLSENSFVITVSGKKLQAIVTANDIEVEFVAEPIKEKLPGGATPLRIAIRLKEKVADPSVKITFTPFE